MEELGRKLKHQKELREKAKKPRKKQEYTPVEIDTGLDDEQGGFENDPLPGEESIIKVKSPKNKPLPAVPPNKKDPDVSPSSPRKSSTPPATSSKPKARRQTASKDEGPPAGGDGPPATHKKPGKSKGANSVAFLQELAAKNNKGKVAAGEDSSSSSSNGKHHQISSRPYTAGESKFLPQEPEPLYANTDLSQSVPKEYENYSFDGPPDVSGEGSSFSSQSEYENVGFKTKKQQLQPQTKKKPSKSPTPTRSSASLKGHGLDKGAGGHVNGTSGAGSEYQNVNFSGQRH